MIKKFIIDKSMITIKNNYPDYSKEQLEKIQYGLESVYLSVTKVVAIILMSIILNIFVETLILLLVFNLIRTTGFGLHATKSWICWITSVPTFISVPLICKYVSIDKNWLIIIAIFSLINFILFAPADTVKRPLIRKNKRIIYKFLTIIIGTIYTILIIFLNNSFIQSTLSIAMLIEAILICPLTYKFFNLPYNNYKNYN